MQVGRVKRRRIRNKTGYDTQLIARLWTRVLRDYKNPTTDFPLTMPLCIQYDPKLKIGDSPGASWHRAGRRMVIYMPPVLCSTIYFIVSLYYFATWGTWVNSDGIPEFHKIAETYGYNLIDIPNRKVNHP